MEPESAFRATTESEVAVMISEGRSGNRRSKIGVKIKPPPAPTIVPKIPTLSPNRRNSREKIIKGAPQKNPGIKIAPPNEKNIFC
jgi:hypothetical protein